MAVSGWQAGYRFVNTIDRLTSDNYFLPTSLRMPRAVAAAVVAAAKFERPEGTSAENRFDSRRWQSSLPHPLSLSLSPSSSRRLLL